MNRWLNIDNNTQEYSYDLFWIKKTPYIWRIKMEKRSFTWFANAITFYSIMENIFIYLMYGKKISLSLLSYLSRKTWFMKIFHANYFNYFKSKKLWYPIHLMQVLNWCTLKFSTVRSLTAWIGKLNEWRQCLLLIWIKFFILYKSNTWEENHILFHIFSK